MKQRRSSRRSVPRTATRYRRFASSSGAASGNMIAALPARILGILVAACMATVSIALSARAATLRSGAHAAGDTQVTITPQQPMLSENPLLFAGPLTDSPAPSFLIQGPPGTLTCLVRTSPIMLFSPIACGPPPPSCPTGACAVLTFGAFTGTQYIDVSDNEGDREPNDLLEYAFDSDQTPPGVSLEGLTVPEPHEPSNLNGPTMFVAARDDVDSEPDTVQCSLTGPGAPPAWVPCQPVPDRRDFSYTLPYPNRHVDYIFEARAVDGFGRVSTPVSEGWDPTPCRVSAPPRPLSRLARSGISLIVTCDDAGGGYEATAYFRGVNGHNLSVSRALGDTADVSRHVPEHATSFRSRIALRLPRPMRSGLSHDRSASLAIEVDPDGGEHPAVTAVTYRRR